MSQRQEAIPIRKLLAATAVFFVIIGSILWFETGTFSIPLPESLVQLHSDLIQKYMPNAADGKKSSIENEIRGVWVATAYGIDYPSEPTTDPDALRTACQTILDKAAADGMTTIYLQVRPAADAIYPSAYFPWSAYLTGSCGTAPADDFDPLEYWIEQAHARNLKLEAWINPYRICAGAQAKEAFAALPEDSPARLHPEWVVECEGGYYFDPSSEGVRNLICKGVSEIVKNYAVDGIQFDDYFYPSVSFNDSYAYAEADTELSRADWRRENVNLLVEAVSRTVHQNARNMECVFGISPSGIWRNKGINSFGGSDTNGYEHYTSSYADSLTWIQNGWVDYIAPQIYWEIGNESADFEVLANWWANHLHGSQTKLILGLAAYKIGDDSAGTVWETDGCAELHRQITMLREIENIDGYSIFSYQNLANNASLSALLTAENIPETD